VVTFRKQVSKTPRTVCGQQRPNLGYKKEGAKQIGRPAGNSGLWDDDEKCQGMYIFEELERVSSRF